jgi:Cu2+-exporting ATPase
MHHAGMNHGAMDHAGMHHGAHDRHAGHGVHMFRSRFWISLLLTIPTIVWGHMPANLIRGTWRASSSC